METIGQTDKTKHQNSKDMRRNTMKTGDQEKVREEFPS